jgi:uncharacterized protein (TIGR04222 family)
MSLGPFDLTGPHFLQLYGALFVLTVIAGFVIPRWLRPDGRAPSVTDPDQLAYLAGGPLRFYDAVAARLLATQALRMVGRDKFSPAISPREGRTPAERSVLALPSLSNWTMISRALKPYADPIRERLVREELLMDNATVWQMRFWQTSPWFLLLLFGATKWEIGAMRDKPVAILTVCLIFTAIFTLFRFIAVDQRTQGAFEVLADARSRSDRLRRAPTATETDLAVALFGTMVLTGSSYAAFHTMRASSDGGSSGGDSGGGCGGGGGGGCGGCGS